MRVAFGAMGSALTSAHRNSRPCITASDVPALNLLHLPSTRSLTYQGVYLSVLAGRTMHHPRLLTLNSQVHRDSAPHLLTSIRSTLIVRYEVHYTGGLQIALLREGSLLSHATRRALARHHDRSRLRHSHRRPAHLEGILSVSSPLQTGPRGVQSI